MRCIARVHDSHSSRQCCPALRSYPCRRRDKQASLKVFEEADSGHLPRRSFLFDLRRKNLSPRRNSSSDLWEKFSGSPGFEFPDRSLQQPLKQTQPTKHILSLPTNTSQVVLSETDLVPTLKLLRRRVPPQMSKHHSDGIFAQWAQINSRKQPEDRDVYF